MANYMHINTGSVFTEQEINESMESWYQDYLDAYEPENEYDPEDPMTLEEYEDWTWNQMEETDLPAD